MEASVRAVEAFRARAPASQAFLDSRRSRARVDRARCGLACAVAPVSSWRSRPRLTEADPCECPPRSSGASIRVGDQLRSQRRGCDRWRTIFEGVLPECG